MATFKEELFMKSEAIRKPSLKRSRNSTASNQSKPRINQKPALTSDLPSSIKGIYKAVDTDGNELGVVVVEAVNAKGRPFFMPLDLMQLAMGRHDDVARMVVKADMHDYLSAKRLRELGAITMQNIGDPMHLVVSDGLKCIKFQGKAHRFYVHRGVVYPLGDMPSIKIGTVPTAAPVPHSSCDVELWNKHIGKHLKGNPYLLTVVLAALSAVLIRTFNLPRLILVLVGQSSLGKTTAQQVAQSLLEQAKDIENCSGTANGIRVRLEQNQDCPAFLDELHMAEDLDGLVKLIFLIGNSASRKTSTSDQQAHKALPLTCGLIAASEKSLAEIVANKRITLTEGVSARLIELFVPGNMGIFHAVPKGMTPKQFSDQLKTACETYYGAIWDAWISGLSNSYGKINTWLPEKLNETEAKLCAGLEVSDRVTLRMVRGLAVWVCAGYAAVNLKLLKVSHSEVLETVKLVLREHLARQKHGTTPIGEKVIQFVRNLIDRNANRFPPLAMFGRTEQSGIYGYTKGHADERLFLFLPGVFEEVIGAQYGKQPGNTP